MNSFALKDMKKRTGLLRYIEGNLEIMNAYPEGLNAALAEWFRVDGTTRSEKIKRIRRIVTSKRNVTRILRDAYTFGRKLM